MSAKTILILGGGAGGIVTANELRRKLPPEHRVVLVEKNPGHAFAPSFLWLMTGDRRPEKITAPLGSLLRPGIELIEAQVQRINIQNNTVTTSREPVTYDYLVVALGTELAPEIIPGLALASYSFYTFEETKKLKTTLSQFTGGKIALVVSSLPYKCPGAPHEAAMLISDYFARRRELKDKVKISLYTPESQPMPVAGPELGAAVRQMLASQEISFNPLYKLVSVDGKNRNLSFEGKEPVPYDLLIAIPPHRASSIVREAGLANETGWLPVERLTLKTKFEKIYAVGDITSVSIPGRWKPDVPMLLPKAGVFAHLEAEVVSERISDEINGVMSGARFSGAGYCMLEAGSGVAGFAYGDFFAEPAPRLNLRNPDRMWHWGKVLFEKWWLAPFGIRKAILHYGLSIGARILGIPMKA